MIVRRHAKCRIDHIEFSAASQAEKFAQRRDVFAGEIVPPSFIP